MHPRNAGLEEPFLQLMPDYLEGMTLRGLGGDMRRPRCTAARSSCCEAEHVAARPISLELHVERVARHGAGALSHARFSELLAADATPEEIVVTFLAMLELYKRGAVDLVQDRLFGDIEVLDVTDEDVD